MKKKLFILVLSLMLVIGVAGEAQSKSLLGQFYGMMRGIFGGEAGGGVSGGACSDHVVELAASGAHALTLGDGAAGNYWGQTFVPGNNGTIKTIEVYTGGTVAGRVVTLRWKHRTGSTDFDLSSYIDTITATPANGGYTMFNVTDTVVSSADFYMVGVGLTTGTAGDIQVYSDQANPYAGGLLLSNEWQGSRASWVIDDNEDYTGSDLRVRFTICY